MISTGHTLGRIAALGVAGAALSLSIAGTASAGEEWGYEHISTTQAKYSLTDAEQARIVKADKDADSTVMTKLVNGSGNVGANLNVKDAPAGNTIVIVVEPEDCEHPAMVLHSDYYSAINAILSNTAADQGTAKTAVMGADSNQDSATCVQLSDGDFWVEDNIL